MIIGSKYSSHTFFCFTFVYTWKIGLIAMFKIGLIAMFKIGLIAMFKIGLIAMFKIHNILINESNLL